MVVIKCSDKVKGSVDNIDNSLCDELYKDEGNSLVPWSGTEPNPKMNCFTWYKEENDWIIPEDHYSEELKK